MAGAPSAQDVWAHGPVDGPQGQLESGTSDPGCFQVISIVQIPVNTSFRRFPDSSATKGDKSVKLQLSAEAIALRQMMKRIHF
jgi:hypothetical protein